MSIVCLKTVSQDELLHLLYRCSHLLNDAYQETLADDFKIASYETSLACEYLRCELAQNSLFTNFNNKEKTC